MDPSVIGRIGLSRMRLLKHKRVLEGLNREISF